MKYSIPGNDFDIKRKLRFLALSQLPEIFKFFRTSANIWKKARWALFFYENQNFTKKITFLRKMTPFKVCSMIHWAKLQLLTCTLCRILLPFQPSRAQHAIFSIQIDMSTFRTLVLQVTQGGLKTKSALTFVETDTTLSS